MTVIRGDVKNPFIIDHFQISIVNSSFQVVVQIQMTDECVLSILTVSVFLDNIFITPVSSGIYRKFELMDDIAVDRELICTFCSKPFASINDLQVKCLACERPVLSKCNIDDHINIPYSKMGISDSSSDIRCLQNEQLVDQLHPSSAILHFAPLQSIFTTLIKRIGQLNEKVDRQEKQFHQQNQIHDSSLNTYINQFNDRLTEGQIQIKELQTKNHELEETNHRLNACTLQLSQQLYNDEIQMKRFEDENRQLKEQVHQLEKQTQQQYQTHNEQFGEFNDRLNLCFKQLNDQSKRNEELPIETGQLNEQIIESGIATVQNHNQPQIDFESLPDGMKHKSG
jgi:hypothetical protein